MSALNIGAVKFGIKIKKKFARKLFLKQKKIIPDIEASIELKILATPCSFQKFTYNTNGALFGWAAIPSQIDRKIFPYYTSIDNLYLTGHWVTNGIGQSGIPVVALSGRYTAQTLLRYNKL